MKLQRIFMLGLIATSMALITSCSDGEDGTDGLDGATGPAGAVGPAGAAGADGTDGVDGTNGTDGVNGADGNANVTRYSLDVSAIANGVNPLNLTSNTYPDLAILGEEGFVENHIILLYLTIDNDYYPIPGLLPLGNNGYFFSVKYNGADESIVLEETIGNGWLAIIDTLEMIVIETGAAILPDLMAKSGSVQTDYLSFLKAEGVDVSDYKEVKLYFGLD